MSPRIPLNTADEINQRIARETNRRVNFYAANPIGIDRRLRELDSSASSRQMLPRLTLTPHQFIRRFLIHVLPKGFHRIRHYGLLANTNRAESIARARELLGAAPRIVEPEGEKHPARKSRACCPAAARAAAAA